MRVVCDLLAWVVKNVVGLEAVLGDGTIIDNMSCLRKDNTGYDLAIVLAAKAPLVLLLVF